jgi:hypothetical protein
MKSKINQNSKHLSNTQSKWQFMQLIDVAELVYRKWKRAYEVLNCI